MFTNSSTVAVTAPWPPIPLFVPYSGADGLGASEKPPTGETAVVYDVNGD